MNLYSNLCIYLLQSFLQFFFVKFITFKHYLNIKELEWVHFGTSFIIVYPLVSYLRFNLNNVDFGFVSSLFSRQSLLKVLCKRREI
jgi:hypothetical protein